MAYDLKSSTFTLATILNLIAQHPNGVTFKKLKHQHQELASYSVKDRIKHRKGLFTETQGKTRFDISYKINQEGLDYLEEYKHEIVEDLATVEPIFSEKRTYKPRVPAEPSQSFLASQPAPVYSSTAQQAIDSLAVIIDANEGARVALEGLYKTTSQYFEENPIDNLPKDAGMFREVIEEMYHYRSLMQNVLSIVEPQQSLQGVEDEPSQTSLIG